MLIKAVVYCRPVLEGGRFLPYGFSQAVVFRVFWSLRGGRFLRLLVTESFRFLVLRLLKAIVSCLSVPESGRFLVLKFLQAVDSRVLWLLRGGWFPVILVSDEIGCFPVPSGCKAVVFLCPSGY